VYGKRKAVTEAAYEYLKWCAHWCRARVEERARREAAELAEALIAFMGELRDELISHAALLAQIEAKLLSAARAWNEKAVKTKNVGTVLTGPAEWFFTGVRSNKGTGFGKAQNSPKCASVFANTSPVHCSTNFCNCAVPVTVPLACVHPKIPLRLHGKPYSAATNQPALAHSVGRDTR
jgi:hypothetical protein